MLKEPKMSKSKVGAYDSCPWNWKLSYIDKLKGPPTSALIKGINVHTIPDNFFQHSTNYEEGLKFISTFPTALKYKENTRNFLRFIKKLGYMKPLFMENMFTNERHNLNGRVDVVFELPNGEIIVLDYKTGRTKDVSKHRFELAFYVILIQPILNKIGKKITHWGILFLDEPDMNKAFSKERVIPNEIDKCLLHIENTRKKIKMELFPKKPRYGCAYCSHFGVNCEGK